MLPGALACFHRAGQGRQGFCGKGLLAVSRTVQSENKKTRNSLNYEAFLCVAERYTFSTLASGRIMSRWLRKGIGSAASDTKF